MAYHTYRQVLEVIPADFREQYEDDLTREELSQGWHFCREFDGMLTDGEIVHPGTKVCICGFGRRKYD